MDTRPVHWDEGMFLRPHHFQTQQRYTHHLVRQTAKWDTHYNWGLRAVDIDPDALGNGRVVVRSLQARLRDGTQVSVPEDGVLPPLPLRPLMDEHAAVTVYLAAPAPQPGRANSSGEQYAQDRRYRVESLPLEDENTGLNPRAVKLRALNLRLFAAADAASDALPVCRVEKSGRADAVPQLQPAYIPPVLCCDAWPALSAGVLSSVYDRVGRILRQYAARVRDGRIGFGSQTPADARMFELLRVLNETAPLADVLFFAQGVHPLVAYAELARLVGRLAVFGPRREPPELPRYDHDDLGKCFYAAKQHIDALLSEVDEPEYEERPFVGTGLRMQVDLEPKWTHPSRQMFVGVRTTLRPEECVILLDRGGRMDMKIAAASRVDAVFTRAAAGLEFRHAPKPPRVLPPGVVYFQTDRSSQLEEWKTVQDEATLAVRLNQNLIAGNIQGQESLTVRLPNGQTASLGLALYVVPQQHQEGRGQG